MAAAAVDADEPNGTADATGNRKDPLLVNDGWHIRSMATAHGTFVIEIEAEDPAQTETIARALIEPLRDDYTEIFVYVNRLGDESEPLARRMQWTPGGGYVETIFDQPELDRGSSAAAGGSRSPPGSQSTTAALSVPRTARRRARE